MLQLLKICPYHNENHFMNFQFLTAVWSKWAKSLICFCKKMCETSVGSTFKNHHFFPYWLRQGQRLNLVQNSLRLVESVLLASVFFFLIWSLIYKKGSEDSKYAYPFFGFFPSFWGSYNLLSSLLCSAEMQIAVLSEWGKDKQLKNTKPNNFPKAQARTWKITFQCMF